MNLKDNERKLLDEYNELTARLGELTEMLDDWDWMDFVHECPRVQLANQRDAMIAYRNAIEHRTDFMRLMAEAETELKSAAPSTWKINKGYQDGSTVFWPEKTTAYAPVFETYEEAEEWIANEG